MKKYSDLRRDSSHQIGETQQANKDLEMFQRSLLMGEGSPTSIQERARRIRQEKLSYKLDPNFGDLEKKLTRFKAQARIKAITLEAQLQESGEQIKQVKEIAKKENDPQKLATAENYRKSLEAYQKGLQTVAKHLIPYTGQLLQKRRAINEHQIAAQNIRDELRKTQQPGQRDRDGYLRLHDYQEQLEQEARDLDQHLLWVGNLQRKPEAGLHFYLPAMLTRELHDSKDSHPGEIAGPTHCSTFAIARLADWGRQGGPTLDRLPEIRNQHLSEEEKRVGGMTLLRVSAILNDLQLPIRNKQGQQAQFRSWKATLNKAQFASLFEVKDLKGEYIPIVLSLKNDNPKQAAHGVLVQKNADGAAYTIWDITRVFQVQDIGSLFHATQTLPTNKDGTFLYQKVLDYQGQQLHDFSNQPLFQREVHAVSSFFPTK